MKPAILQICLLVFLPLVGCKKPGADVPTEYGYRPSPVLTPAEEASLTAQANAGDTNAAFRLYTFYSDYKIPLGDTNALVLATKWLKMTAEKGLLVAQWNYALELQDSERAEDRAEALHWLERAGTNGHPYALATLADAYESGKGTPVTLSKAKYWYERAALMGHRLSMSMLVEFLKEGKGCERDLVGAYAWASLGESRFPKGTVAQGIAQKKREDIQKSLTAAELKAGLEKLKDLREMVPVNEK